MDNYPDDIGDYRCPGCREIVPNCVCREDDIESRYEKALNGDDEDTYYEMFDSIESDEVVKLLRSLHRHPSEHRLTKLIDYLDSMLIKHLEN